MNELARKKAERTERTERPTVDQWVKAVTSQIRRACRGRYYGKITLEIANGSPTRIHIERSVKDPRVALDEDDPVG